jgi:hypothetical protein
LPPFLVEALELGLRRIGVEGRVDRFEVAGDVFALPSGHVFEAVADQMDVMGTSP